MYALRERRVHVTQEDFEMAVAKVNVLPLSPIVLVRFLVEMTMPLNSFGVLVFAGHEEGYRQEHELKEALEVKRKELSPLVHPRMRLSS